ncbi:hypothetical protein CBM2626_A60319 [Cupriavidus taiwanensis]|nr:hypothetical protein CBM2626_A60319 [Cupriavidus taiwanensis]
MSDVPGDADAEVEGGASEMDSGRKGYWHGLWHLRIFAQRIDTLHRHTRKRKSPGTLACTGFPNTGLDSRALYPGRGERI